MHLIITTTTRLVLADGTEALALTTTTNKRGGDNPRFYVEEADKAHGAATKEHSEVLHGALRAKGSN